jgi:hypothetical protein
MSGIVEGVVLMLVLAGATPEGGKGELWLVHSMAFCEAALADAIEKGHAVEGRCLPANIDLDAWAAALGQPGAPL